MDSYVLDEKSSFKMLEFLSFLQWSSDIVQFAKFSHMQITSERASTINNVLANFNPHDTTTSNDRNLPWFNNEIENLINKKNTLYKL